ncbi:DinB family protein [Crinalium epipsammum PCC 9333]|uniref:DinB family protein n=1 Tax=Crinalium epipsammum PCC 9333 TaxID=1173022 RepID=K9VY07_9CYAN|nr:DinB family protein [Crinalium epipsammum]AFZ13003.1 DinB family protein [Crinalium epipsammum PCC 9333]
MNTINYFQRLSEYNQWMNEQIYTVCESLPDAIRKEDRKAFFGSIHGTLNHILLADKVWLGKFLNQQFKVQSLDQELYAEFTQLREARIDTDRQIKAWVNSLTDEQLAAPFKFTSVTQTRECVFPLWHVAVHFFNHQTHHRGQVTTLLTQCGKNPGVTDFLLVPGAELI